MYMSNYFETQALNTLLGITYTAPGAVYAALSSVNPGETGGVMEPSYPGYVRLPIIFSVPGAMSGGTGIQNTGELQFAQSSQDGATITHVGIFDSASGGNMLMYAALNTPKQIRAGVAPVLRTGEAKFWLTGNFSTAFRTMILNALRGTSISGKTPFATLYNGNPESGGTELAGGSFVRKPVVFGSPVEQAGGQMMIVNNAEIVFEVATTNLGTYDHDVIVTAETGAATFLTFKQGLTDSYTSGDRTSYDVGAYSVSLH